MSDSIASLIQRALTVMQSINSHELYNETLITTSCVMQPVNAAGFIHIIAEVEGNPHARSEASHKTQVISL